MRVCREDVPWKKQQRFLHHAFSSAVFGSLEVATVSLCTLLTCLWQNRHPIWARGSILSGFVIFCYPTKDCYVSFPFEVNTYLSCPAHCVSLLPWPPWAAFCLFRFALAFSAAPNAASASLAWGRKSQGHKPHTHLASTYIVQPWSILIYRNLMQ